MTTGSELHRRKGEYPDGVLPFSSEDEAREYARQLAWQLFQEIANELAVANAGHPAMLDLTYDEMLQICHEAVFPDVWKTMGGAIETS